MALFDLGPKDSRRTLYGRTGELDLLVRLIRQGRWAAILGPRMVGKTSLAKVAATLSGRPTVYVNLWGAVGTHGLLNALLRGIGANRTVLRRLRSGLRRIEGVTLGGASITLAPRPEPFRTVADLVHLIGREAGRSVIILDEVQELAPVAGLLQRLLGNVFNSYPEVDFVFTGSYFGLLRSLLDPAGDSPLLGRSPARIQLEPFDRATSIAFLEHGFRECHVSPDRGHVEAAVARSLDGIPGWLTLFGNHVAVEGLSVDAAERATVQEGKEVARSELAHFLERRESALYWAALRRLTSNCTWTELRDAMVARRGAPVNDNSVGNVLRALRDAHLIGESEHQYSLRDPMVRAFVQDARQAPP